MFLKNIKIEKRLMKSLLWGFLLWQMFRQKPRAHPHVVFGCSKSNSGRENK